VITDDPAEPQRSRRTDAQVKAELKRKLAKIESREVAEARRRDTLRKILLGAGLLALKDPRLVMLAEEALSPRDQLRMQELRQGASRR
jgi:hypothetical protein